MAEVVAKSHFVLPVQFKLKHKEKLLLEFSVAAVNQERIYNRNPTASGRNHLKVYGCKQISHKICLRHGVSPVSLGHAS